MTEDELDQDRQLSELSAGQLVLLGGFEREAADVFPGLGFAEAGDAALVERLADAAIAGAAPTVSGGEAASPGPVAGSKLASLSVSLGATAVVGIVVVAIWWGLRSDPQSQSAHVPPQVEDAPAVEVEDSEPASVTPVATAASEQGEPTVAPASPEPVEAAEVAARPPELEPRSTRHPRRGPTPAPEPALSARDLLKAANAARRTGDYAKASAGYERLGREFPGTREDLIGRVSLGKLRLERLNDPGEALHHFDAYLDANARGNLAEEALYGRARALQRLGKSARERGAWSDLLRRFPNSVHADEARERMAAAGD